MQRNNSISMTMDNRGGANTQLQVRDQFERRRNTIMAARTETYNTPEMSIDLIGTNPFAKYQDKHIKEHVKG